MTGPNSGWGLKDPAIMRRVALGMADGQIEQADRWLCFIDGRAPKPDRSEREPLVRALGHMRSACGWLQAGARA